MKNNKIIKNLKVRSIALTLATITGLSLVGCTEKVEAEDIAPTQTATIEVMETPKTTLLPTIEPTPTITVEPTMEPTATPYNLTWEDVEKMADKIYNDNIEFFSVNLTELFATDTQKNIRTYTKEDIINIICYMNDAKPKYVTENTYVNGIYDPMDVFEFYRYSIAFWYYHKDNEIDSFMNISDFFDETSYEYELFKSIDDNFRYIMTETATQEEVSEFFGMLIKIQIDEPINGYVVSEEINTIPYFISVACGCVLMDAYADTKGIPFSSVYVKLDDIFSNLENDSRGNEKFPVMCLEKSGAEKYDGIESIPSEAEYLVGFATTKYQEVLEQLENYTPTKPLTLILD